MKIRIQENSIRFRLMGADLDSLLSLRLLTESLHFSPSGAEELEFCLKLESLADISLTYKNNKVTLHIPEQLVRELASDSNYSLVREIQSAQGKVVKVTVELDGKCSHNFIDDIQTHGQEKSLDNFSGIH